MKNIVITKNGQPALTPNVKEWFETLLPAAVLEALKAPPITLTPAEVARLVEHSARQSFSTPPDPEFSKRLTDSIRTSGLLTPILLLGNRIVDGAACLKACLATGATPTFHQLPPEAEPCVEQLLIVRNFARRHLGKSQLAMLGAQICVGFETESAQRSLAALQGQAVQAKGKSADRAAKIFGVSASLVKSAKLLLGTPYAQKVWTGKWTVAQARRDQRTAAAKHREIQKALNHPPHSGEIEVLFGDFTKVLNRLPDSSVDLILTDPPYHEKWLPLWGDLAALAMRVLKPGGLLVAMSGQEFLPEVFAQIKPHPLTWGWQWQVHFQGPTSFHPAHGFVSCGRPILVYYKPNPKTNARPRFGEGGKDVIFTSGVDQTFHPFGQKVEVYEELLQRFSQAGDLVVDPFGGGGTVARACANLGRRCVTSEIVHQHYQTIHERIFGYLPQEQQRKTGSH